MLSVPRRADETADAEVGPTKFGVDDRRSSAPDGALLVEIRVVPADSFEQARDEHVVVAGRAH
jgi:hypothetical protein